MILSVQKILQKLIRCESITPHDGGCFEYITSLLSSLGFVCEEFDQKGVSNRFYTLARTGPYHLCFAGHVDVVPPQNPSLWMCDPFEGKEVNGVIYGRGAVDMKGAIAAFMAMLPKLIQETEHTLSLMLTSDEEGDATYGTKVIVEHLRARGEKINMCIVGEPTSEIEIGDTLKWGRRGSLSAALTLCGVGGHVAYPAKAENPLPPMIHLLHTLLQTFLDEGCEGFDPSMLQITSIDVGNATSNVIPSEVTARLNIRFNPLHTTKTLMELIQREVDAVCTSGITAKVIFAPGSHPFYGMHKDMAEGVCEIFQKHDLQIPFLSTSGGTSDARFIKDLCPTIELGLKNKTAHHVDEHVSIKDLEALSKLYLILGMHFHEF